MRQVLFDLDGTLVDSLPGIVRAINHALADVGRASLTPGRIRGFVGRPLRDIFRELLGPTDPATVERVVGAYRRRFEIDGVEGCDAFPGIRDALDALRDTGCTMRVATVKPTGTAGRVLQRLGLDHYFRSVHGADQDEHTSDKVAIVGAALDAGGDGGASAVMIGDRVDDIRAARAHGIAAIGVGWGYGGVDELREAWPDLLAERPEQIVPWLAARD